MANLRWIYGTFGDGQGSTNVDGTMSINNVLPVIKGSDSISQDIKNNNNITLEITAIKNQGGENSLPDTWNNILIPGKTAIALVDIDRSWNDVLAVKAFGYLNKVDASVRGRIKLQAASVEEYLNHLLTVDFYEQIQTDGNAGVEFQGAAYEQLISAIIYKAFDSTNVPVGQRVAQVLGTVNIAPGGTGVKLKSLYREGETYGEILSKIRDSLSDFGTEYRFVPRWSSSDKARIVCDVLVGGSDSITNAHINEQQEFTITLNNTSDVKAFASHFGITYEATKIVTRFVGQSKAGEDGTGADITSKGINSRGLPRFDSLFNPGVELTTAQMNEQLSSRLSFSNNWAGASYTAEEDFEGLWIPRLGSTLHFVGQSGTETEGYTVTVRLVGLKYSASRGTMEMDLMIPQARYPSLPRSPKDDDTKKPIVPKQNPNVPVTPGGIINPPRPETSELPTGLSSSGRNGYGQLAVGSTQDISTFTQQIKGEIPEDETIVDYGIGPYHSVWLTDAGKVYFAGRRAYFSMDGAIIGSSLSQPYWANSFESVVGLLGDGEGKRSNRNSTRHWFWLKLASNRIINTRGGGEVTFPADIAFFSGNVALLTNGELWACFGNASSINPTAPWRRIAIPSALETLLAPSNIKAFSAYCNANSSESSLFFVTNDGIIYYVDTLASPSATSLTGWNNALETPWEDIILVYRHSSVGGLDNKTIVGKNQGKIYRGSFSPTAVPGTGDKAFVKYLATDTSYNGKLALSIIAKDTNGKMWVYGRNNAGQLSIPGQENITSWTEYVTSSQVDEIWLGSPVVVGNASNYSSSAVRKL